MPIVLCISPAALANLLVSMFCLPTRPSPAYSEQQIVNMARAGLIGATQVDQMTQVIRQAGQPMSMPYLRGELSRNPRNPSAQTYIPAFKQVPVKVCESEFCYTYWINSKGFKHNSTIVDERDRELSVGDCQIKTLTRLYEAGSIDATSEKIAKLRECLTRTMDYLHLR